jgi:uncharacterized RDD family membrane protein YckC
MEENNRKQFKVTPDILARLDQRFLNWFIDTIMQILLFLISFAIIANIANSYGNKELASYLLINPIGQYTYVSIIRLVYYISLETLFGQTIGKLVSQTIVVDENGDRPSHDMVLMRTLCRLIPFYELSFFGILGRGWHDTISKTYVVNKNLLEEKKRQFHSLK